jgi:hypothetical protein
MTNEGWIFLYEAWRVRVIDATLRWLTPRTPRQGLAT